MKAVASRSREEQARDVHRLSVVLARGPEGKREPWSRDAMLRARASTFPALSAQPPPPRWEKTLWQRFCIDEAATHSITMGYAGGTDAVMALAKQGREDEAAALRDAWAQRALDWAAAAEDAGPSELHVPVMVQSNTANGDAHGWHQMYIGLRKHADVCDAPIVVRIDDSTLARPHGGKRQALAMAVPSSWLSREHWADLLLGLLRSPQTVDELTFALAKLRGALLTALGAPSTPACCAGRTFTGQRWQQQHCVVKNHNLGIAARGAARVPCCGRRARARPRSVEKLESGRARVLQEFGPADACGVPQAIKPTSRRPASDHAGRQRGGHAARSFATSGTRPTQRVSKRSAATFSTARAVSTYRPQNISVARMVAGNSHRGGVEAGCGGSTRPPSGAFALLGTRHHHRMSAAG